MSMRLMGLSLLSIFLLAGISCKSTKRNDDADATLLYSGEEKYFKTMRQLTFGGNNAEAYWNTDNQKLVFQSDWKDWSNGCDQIFTTDWKNDNLKKQPPLRVSTGKGRTTCSYFLPGDSLVIYASTHLESDDCPPVPKRRKDGKYVWPIYPSFDIFTATPEGKMVQRLTNTKGYDAEATVSPKGDRIVFTSMRTGDLELFTMDLDGSNVKQVTHQLGYDGGAFFSPDGTQLVFRASRPQTKEEVKNYKALLKEGLVQPTKMELYLCNVDGSNMRKLTNLGNANWAPFFHPSGKKIIFSSNHTAKRGFPFNLYMIDVDGKNLTRITHDETFDAFPVFSSDGKYLVFSSNRHNGGTRDTNLFIAEWKEVE